MNIRTFDLERIQSLYENTVEFNLTESGFHPFSLKELLTPEELDEINNTTLGYGQTNGSIPLRKRIASLYPNCHEENILVTNGSSEANFVACHTLLKKGDEVVMMVPNYMQIWGIAEEMGAIPKSFPLLEKNNWTPNLEELEKQVTSKTKMIALCNPNNPTGYTLSPEEMEAIVKIAKKVGAWIYCDEVYKGAELNGEEIPSFFGLYDKVVVNGGLSKAYALPGLRLGWLAGPQEVMANSWAYHDYTSITAGILSHKVGEIALRPERRAQILNRNRKMLNENLSHLKQWIDQHGELFRFLPPKAGGMAFMHYNLDINSTELSNWLRINKNVFIVPGDCYGMDRFIRIGIGERKDFLIQGLERIKEGLEEIHSLKS
ncbi:aminotransferase class I/II-fold pyridoxal phosphate-dependent enzyme [Xanthovirga aplysinae]|uniref:aminotransferase class I/II-fold pyridoxal phosphate-dependent enzyme n=1 Tax=Xanthovirga aplysinae TaxID=2529853 RepID=UPI0012BB57A9|nr:aminotransferase class I/II-fold pyridoxal phosphate-dependent enzyme [Xanthovirga aplysinae]MTI32970.1 aminotransferase class I/II-fold pyridoxal phosphate-dependent enzyme [Xanthovirga aplysinae]